MLRLKGKTALITGATSGMGEAAAKLFASEGARVAVIGRNEAEGERVVKEIGKESLFIKCDVSNEAQVKSMFDLVVKKWGKLDILYNNAGILVQNPVTETSEDDFNKVINIDLKGVFFCCKHGIPVMSKGGSIINTASIAGLKGLPNLAAYTASKGGVIALTRQLAIEYSKSIRVNCICPGTIYTPMVAKYLKFAPAKLIAEARIKKMVPIGRFGQAEEVAQLALFLASDESSYITGSIITIDGGLTA